MVGKLQVRRRPWTEKEVLALRRFSRTETPAGEVAAALARTVQAVVVKAHKLGLLLGPASRRGR